MDDIESTRSLLTNQLTEEISDDPLRALRSIGALEREIADHERTAVRAAATSHSWAEIGEALGVSRQAAHQRFAKEWSKAMRNEIKSEHKRMKAALRTGAPAEASAAMAKRDAVIEEIKQVARANKRGGRSATSSR